MFNSGDQVVVIKHREDSNRRNEKPKVVINDINIKDRLEEFARQKFDNGDSTGSGSIDRLAQKRREQERIDEVKRNADEAVRRAAEKAAVDPVTVVWKRRSWRQKTRSSTVRLKLLVEPSAER
jgi:hypothetical protein